MAFFLFGCLAIGVRAQTPAPHVTSVTPPANGRYVTGQTLTFQMNFDRAVTVTGSPRVSVAVRGAGDFSSPVRFANYVSGSGSTALRFVYTVESADWDDNGIELGRFFDLNGGTIRGSAGENAAADIMPETDTRQIYLVTQTTGAPRVGAAYVVGRVGAPLTWVIPAGSNATTFSGERLPAGLRVDASAGVITGTPTASVYTLSRISASNGSGTGAADWTFAIHSADGSPLITNATWQEVWAVVGSDIGAREFRIVAEDGPTRFDAQGLPPGLSVDATTGLLRGTPTTAGTYSATFLASNAAGTGSAIQPFRVEAAPRVVTVSRPADGTYTAGDVLTFVVTFNQLMSVNAGSSLPPSLDLRFGSAGPTRSAYAATAASGDGLIFRYTVTTNDAGSGLTVDRISLNGGTITYGGVPANLSFSPVAAPGVNVATPAPPPGAPSISTLASPPRVPVGALFTYQISATGSPTSYSATGLPPGLTLNPNTGEIRGVTGYIATWADVPVVVTLRATNAAGTAVATQLLLQGSGGPIEMPYATRTTPPPNGTYRAGDMLTFTLACDVPYGRLTVTGTPRIPLTIGAATRYATFAGVSDLSSRPNLIFQYMVGPADSAPAGIRCGASIDLNDGAIHDGTGLYFVLSVPPADTSQVLVAAPVGLAAPVITTTSLPDVTILNNREGPLLTATIAATNSPTSFSVTGLPAEGRAAFFRSDGTLTYLPNDLPPGLYNVTFTATNAAGSGSKTLPWAVLPRVVNITPNKFGGYLPGETMNLTAQFSGPVVVTGTPTVTLPGGLKAGYVSGSGTNVLLFARVGSLADYAGGASAGTPTQIDLNGGTILHASGVAAVLNLPNPGPPGYGAMLGVVLPPPQLTQAETSTGAVGQSYSFNLTVSNRADEFQIRTGTLPDGLALDARTGVISGTPRQSGTFALTVGASNFGPAPEPVVFFPTATAQASPAKPLTITISAAVPTVPTNPPVITPPVVSPPVFTPPPAVFTPPPVVKASQSIAFNSPVSAIMIGQPIALGATSSAGLPLTYTLVSGDATLVGNVLTPRSTAELVVRASSAGSETVAAASTDVNFGRPQKAGQSIALAAFADTTGTAAPMTLAATSSVGVPVTYAVTGPARVQGNTLVLNGAAGTVTLRATAAANDSYDGTEVTRTFRVRAAGQQVYLGTAGSDAFAVAVSADNTKGVFVTRIGGSGEAIVAKFALNADGSFATSGTSSLQTPAEKAGVAIAALTSRTVSGTITDGVFRGSIDELGLNLRADIQSPAGPAASLAGLYTASLPGSASGETYVVVSPGGQAYAVAVTPLGVSSGTGTISSAGDFSIGLGTGGAMAGTVNADGSLRGTLRNGNTTAALVGLSEATQRSDRLVNLSSRLRTSGEASRAMIAGFVVAGTEAKPMLIRAIGPGLGAFGVSGALANPRLQLYNSAGTLVAENEDWGNNAAVAAAAEQVGAFKLDAASRDAAMLVTLAPGAYTAQVATNGGDGVALVEVYDASAPNGGATTRQLINISTRGFVDTGDGSLIAGFVVTGNAPKRVLIRGIGPSLTGFGVTGALANPVLKVYASGSTSVIAQNDDWSAGQPIDVAQGAATAAEIAAASTSAGAFPLGANSRDAAVIVTLLPGSYTAVVSDAANGTGAGLVEVYELSTR